MRKILVGIITLLFIILDVNLVMNKIEIGDLEIFGISGIQEQKNSLNSKIAEGNKDIETYTETLSKVDTAYDALQKSKEEYEEKVKTIATTQEEEAKLLQNYSIEFLWVKIGLHRKEEGVELNLTLSSTGSSTETDLLTNREVALYDLKFKVTGTYDAITDFIYSIEEDSSLGFGIEDFTLNPANDDSSNLIAEFTCSDVRIYKDTLTTGSSIYDYVTTETKDDTTEITTDEEETEDSSTNDSKDKTENS
jgi:hypothetical protein